MSDDPKTTPEGTSAEARTGADQARPALIMPRPIPEEEAYFAALLAVNTTPDMTRRWRVGQ